jgi:hypothetical protein
MAEHKVCGRWVSWGRKSGFGIGFDISKFGWSVELGFWYIGQEF